MPTIALDAISISGNVDAMLQPHSLFSGLNGLYFLGVAAFAMIVMFKIFKVISFFKHAEFKNDLKAHLVETNYEQSFTFFNRIHLSSTLKTEERNIVLEHELWHVKLKHTWDLFLMEAYHILFWFNPVILFLKKELVYVHEHQVDQNMYSKHQDDYLKHLVASAMGINSSQLLLTSQFYNGLSLTQRTKQMKRKIKNNWTYLAIIPAFAVGLIFISFTTKSSNAISEFDIPLQDTIYEKADVYPEFKGGQQAMIQYLIEHITYPEEEKAKGVEGTVYCSFVVTNKGKITEPKIVKPVNVAMEEEVLGVVSEMPDWKPGEKDGKKVNVRYILPVAFKLPADEK